MPEAIQDNFIKDGRSFAHDVISGVMTPRFKLQFGEDGTSVDASAANPMPVTSGGGHTAEVTLTRPANADAYLAGDAIGDANGSAILTFANVGKAGGSVMITGLHLQLHLTSSLLGTTTLELYNAAPDAIADNVAWDLVSAGDRGKYLGSLTLSAPTDKGSTLFSQNDGLAHQVKLVSADLYGILRTDSAMASSTSGAVKKITMTTLEV